MSCTISIGGQYAGYGEGTSKELAKKMACDAIVNDSSTNQPVVRVNTEKAVTTPISRDQILAKSKGPISAEASCLVKAALGHYNYFTPQFVTYLTKQTPDFKQFALGAAETILEFTKLDGVGRTGSLYFPPQLQLADKCMLHALCHFSQLSENVRLVNYGGHHRLGIVIVRRLGSAECKRLVLEHGLCGRYELISFGTMGSKILKALSS